MLPRFHICTIRTQLEAWVTPKKFFLQQICYDREKPPFYTLCFSWIYFVAHLHWMITCSVLYFELCNCTAIRSAFLLLTPCALQHEMKHNNQRNNQNKLSMQSIPYTMDLLCYEIQLLPVHAYCILSYFDTLCPCMCSRCLFLEIPLLYTAF